VLNLANLFQAQRAAGFPEFEGAHVAAFIPIAAALLNDVIAGALPADAPISAVQIEPQADNVIRVRLRISRMPIIPPLSVTLLIDRQPQLPHDPVLVLRLASSGLTMIARGAARFLDALPSGLSLEDDRVLVNIAELLRARGQGEWLRYLRGLEITTAPGVMLVSIRASVE
jgi:hypothetical protein